MPKKTQPIIIISGATATGKTMAAIRLHEFLKADQIESEIVNFDSLCFYQELIIGTARPSPEEEKRAPHHLVGSYPITSPLNANQFVEACDPILERLKKENIAPILVGGSGFYLRSLFKEMYEHPKNEQEVDVQELPIDQVIEKLKVVDPESLAKLHENDHYRLRRAYEFFLQTGEKISLAKEQVEEPYNLSHNSRLDAQLLHFNLDVEKESHWKIIQKRTSKMIEQGMISELEDLLARGFDPELKPLQSVGYKEVQQYLKGELTDLEALKERISISTRQLAKSQRTFFKKMTPVVKIDSLHEKAQDRMNQLALEFLKD